MNIASAMDKNGTPTAIGRALLNGLDPELADCRRETMERTLSNGAVVYQTDDGGYYDMCTLEYLGHDTLVEGRKKDVLLDLNDALLYEEGCP